MHQTDHLDRLFDFIRSIAPSAEIGGEQDELSLDSLELLQIVAYLENTFGVRLDEYDVDPDELRSRNGLHLLVKRLTG